MLDQCTICKWKEECQLYGQVITYRKRFRFLSGDEKIRLDSFTVIASDQAY
jgi:hypothetical protein